MLMTVAALLLGAAATRAAGVQTFAVPQPSAGLNDMTLGPGGNLYFTEGNAVGGAYHIGSITPSGTFGPPVAVPVGQYDNPGEGPTNILSSGGSLWFRSDIGNVIDRFAPGGSLTTVFGDPDNPDLDYTTSLGPSNTGGVWRPTTTVTSSPAMRPTCAYSRLTRAPARRRSISLPRTRRHGSRRRWCSVPTATSGTRTTAITCAPPATPARPGLSDQRHPARRSERAGVRRQGRSVVRLPVPRHGLHRGRRRRRRRAARGRRCGDRDRARQQHRADVDHQGPRREHVLRLHRQRQLARRRDRPGCRTRPPGRSRSPTSQAFSRPRSRSRPTARSGSSTPASIRSIA